MSRPPHSVTVPTQYRKAAAVLSKAISEKKSIKSLIYEQKHAKIGSLLALMNKFSDNRDAVEHAIEKTKILVENPKLNPSLARVLITELLFGARKLTGERCKPVACVLSYKDRLQEAISSAPDVPPTPKKVDKPRYVRVNTNSISVEEVVQIFSSEEWRRKKPDDGSYDNFLAALQSMEEDEYLVDIHVPALFIFCAKWKSYWANHNLTRERKIMLQDRATCIVAELLNPKPNSIILDMCASPGMKTIHLSNKMNNRGTIYAIERNVPRYDILCDMVEEAQATCVKPMKADALSIKGEDVPGVEYILVDPTCSGSGMQNRLSIEKSEAKDEERLKKLAGLQIKILLHAMTDFPKVKRIVYSTCSIYEEENEQVVKRCLELSPNFKILNGRKCLERKWNNVGNKAYKGIGKNCLYSLPEKDFTDGIFVAVFERINAGNE